MDLGSVSSIQQFNQYANFNYPNALENDTFLKQKGGIVVVKKGEAGYSEDMDKDENGEISFEEFSTYCEENDVKEQEKLALLSTIQSTKYNQEIENRIKEEKAQKAEKIKEQEEKAQEEKEAPPTFNLLGSEQVQQQNDEKQIIYARKGEDKYDKSMDEDGNNVVTYEEYMRYCAKKTQEEYQEKQLNKFQKAYGIAEEMPEYGIEVTA